MARLALLALAGTLAAACARSPAKRAQEAATELRSWDATLELLREQEARGAVPAGFAEQVRRAAAEGRAKAEGRLRDARSR